MVFSKAQIKHSLRFLSAKVFPSLTRQVFYSKYSHFLKTNELPNGWSENELKLLPEILNINSVFVDIGSNVGVYTYVASRIVGESNVIAFEPMPQYCNYLKSIFPNAKIEQLALSSVSGSQNLKVPTIGDEQYTARATLNTEFIEDDEQIEKSTLLKVETSTLDDYLKTVNIDRLDIIKIDVEGHEHNVLSGAIKSIQKFKPTLIVEIEQRHHDFNIQNIIDEVCALGYRCLYYSNNEGELIELDPKLLIEVQNASNFGTKKYVNNFVFKALEEIRK